MNMPHDVIGDISRFADYFVICGLDIDSGLEPDRLSGDNLQCSPLDRPYKGKVLVHYPENVSTNPFDEHAICMLCLPAGLLFRTQKHSIEPHFHSFVITREDATRYYGYSLVFYEEVRNRNICSAMHTLQAMHITELSSGQAHLANSKKSQELGTKNGTEVSRSLPRSFRLSPHVTNSALSYYDITKDKLFVAKSIGLVCQMPYIRVVHIFLLNLLKSLPRQPGPGLSPESYVYNLLYEVPLPNPGQSLRFYVPPPEPHLNPVPVIIQRPAPPEELPLLDYPLRELFIWLGVDCVIQLFTCVLLENQVLLRSSDYNRLMLVAESIMSLLLPFSWPHVYVPILPTPLQHFLDAPVPFVMGLHGDTAGFVLSVSGAKGISLGSEAALCLVDIDKPDIQLPEELPIFPHRSAFVEELNQILDKFQVPRLDQEPCKFYAPINGMSQRNLYPDSMSSSCTLPSGGSRRKHSAHDILEWDETRPLAGSPPRSPPHTPRAPPRALPRAPPRAAPRAAPRSAAATRSDALQRIVDIVRRTGVNIEDLDTETVMPTMKRKTMTEEEQYYEDMKFNHAIRESFLNRFVQMFSTYEQFVIMSDQDKETWLSARETMQNFDKAAFLSDQTQHHRPFLSRFLETQMFASLVDAKIMAHWGDRDTNLEVFENRIKLFKRRGGGGGAEWFQAGVWGPNVPGCSPPSPDAEAILPSERLEHRAAYYRAFPPALDAAALRPPHSSALNSDRVNSLRRVKNNSKWRALNTSDILMLNNKDRKLSITDTTPAAISQNNKAFVEKLLKECKSKTKRMLVEKMEGAELGLGTEVSITGVEETTMIVSLCDLLERAWAHGLQHRLGKSALWMHLTNFQELEQCSDTSKPIDPNFLTPDLSSLGSDQSNTVPVTPPPAGDLQTPGSRSSSRAASRDGSRDRLSGASPARQHPSSAQSNPMRPLPESLTFDMRNIQAMSDIKTEIGFARAWIRLSLEKKLLAKHLGELLSDITLLKSQYKRTAFLRCEDEREKFLYHLLTLNAVDYFCFTNTYPTAKLPYRVLIVPSRKAGATTANCWVSISGTNGSTQQIPIPKSAMEFVFHHKNLGILTTLRVGHDNAGISPKWMLDHIYVRNEVTGHAYRFPCRRWLGFGVDDGSIERLLVGSAMWRQGANGTGLRGSAEATGDRGRTASPVETPAAATTHLSPSTIQHMIGDCVNAIVKWHYQSRKDKDTTISVLLCGENGLVKCLEQAFLCGFKSSRLFGKNLFIWDYFVRVKDEFEQSLAAEGSMDSVSGTPAGSGSSTPVTSMGPSRTAGLGEYSSRQERQERRAVWRCYCHLLHEICSEGRALGKDGKFQLFVCLSLREHWLHRMLVPMAITRVTSDMYEEQSFLRKRGLLTFLRQILEPLDDIDIILENSITQGISSYS